LLQAEYFLPVHGFLPDIASSWSVAGRRLLQQQRIYLRCRLDFFLFKEDEISCSRKQYCSIAATGRQHNSHQRVCDDQLKRAQDASICFTFFPEVAGLTFDF
jgi:hypothetical protein